MSTTDRFHAEGDPAMCPRCRSDQIMVLATSQVEDVWEVRQCRGCLFSWRSTEPETITDPDLYSERFRLSEQDITEAGDFPPIPARRTTP